MDDLFPPSKTECVTNRTHDTTLTTPADPPTQFRIDRCRVDVDACPDLCEITMEHDMLSGTQTKCSVKFHDNGNVDVEVGFQQQVGSPSCPEPGPGIDNVGIK